MKRSKAFEPIAIIGHACLLPGALNSGDLWKKILSKEDCLSAATEADWLFDPNFAVGREKQGLVSTARCGLIQGFENIFNPNNFYLPADFILTQDVLLQWLMHTGREALHDAGFSLTEMLSQKAGAVIGNLSYPTQTLELYSEAIWLEYQTGIVRSKPHPANRFMSGLPIQLMAKGLALKENAFAIDAACSSSLYAIKLACDRLQDRTADLMLSGAVNASESFMANVGFEKFHALSKTGQSRPLHEEADGLIPSQGAGIVVLKRLHDALIDRNSIQGVIRGIGLSNDGKSSGFLFPTQVGQVRSMQKAYAQSDIKPEDISFIACHATGTRIGDATEIQSIHTVFGQRDDLTLHALKANIGHPVTAAGIASIIQIIQGFKSQLKPPTREAHDKPLQLVRDYYYKILAEPEPWFLLNGKRIAGINCFGFGGTNAHLILEDGSAYSYPVLPHFINSTPEKKPDIAIVGIGVITADINNIADFRDALFSSTPRFKEYSPGFVGGKTDSIELVINKTRFPPVDLDKTLGQQLAILRIAQDVCAEVKNIKPESTSVLVGLQCDTDLCPYGLGGRVAQLLPEADSNWVHDMREHYIARTTLATLLGAMPNIAANRVNQQFNFKNPGFSVSAEEASGLVALQIGMRDLQTYESDMVLVGAVDFCCDIVHHVASREYLAEQFHVPGDAAVILALKRIEDAKKDGDVIYAVLPSQSEEEANISLTLDINNSHITKTFGHAQAASGLLHVAAAVVACHEKILPDGSGQRWNTHHVKRTAKTVVKTPMQDVHIICQEV